MKSMLSDPDLLTKVPLLSNADVQARLFSICERYNIARLSLFGSTLRADFSANSDIDFLVEFQPENRIGLIRLATLELELTDLLQRQVDVRTASDLSQYFRDHIRESAHELYTA